MKTTLDLPAEMWPARSGWNPPAAAGARPPPSLTRLVTDAVRRAYAAPGPAAGSRLDLTPGRAVVTPPRCTAKVTSEQVRAALYD